MRLCCSVGNNEFAEMFNLLVGLSFRVKHRGDVLTSETTHLPLPCSHLLASPVAVYQCPALLHRNTALAKL